MRRPHFLALATVLVVPHLASLHAAPATPDAPPIDPAQLLQALKVLKDAQATQMKTSRQNILKTAQSAAATPAAAAAAWIEAVRQTQFEGAEKEGAQFRDWKDKEGALFGEKEVQSAAQLYFRWLAITVQRAQGTPVKELLSSLIQYTRDVLGDAAAMESLEEHATKEKDRTPGRTPNARANRNANDEQRIRREHDQILTRALPNSAPVRALHAEEAVKVEGSWEMQPGDVDGIYAAIILPEFRAARDTRALEYWEMKMKLEADAVKNKPAFDQEKFTKERRPELSWNRAKELIEIGQRNRGISELFQILRVSAQHPKFSTWVTEFEQIVSPAPAAPPAPAAQ